MLRKFLLISLIAIAGCTSVTKYEAVIYKDGFISKDGNSVYILKQRMLHTSTYFYAVVDTYGESDSLIGAQILKLGLDGTVEKDISLNIKTSRFISWNDSVVELSDSAGTPIKVNFLSGTVSRLQHDENFPLILDDNSSDYYILSFAGNFVSVLKKSFYDDRTDFPSASITITPMYDSIGYPRYKGINYLLGKNTLCLYTGDSLYLCNVDSWNIVSIANIPKCKIVLPLSATKFICSTSSSAGIYSLDEGSLTLVENIYATDYEHVVTDTSAVNAIRVKNDNSSLNTVTRIVLLNLRTGKEKQLCAGSRDTL